MFYRSAICSVLTMLGISAALAGTVGRMDNALTQYSWIIDQHGRLSVVTVTEDDTSASLLRQDPVTASILPQGGPPISILVPISGTPLAQQPIVPTVSSSGPADSSMARYTWVIDQFGQLVSVVMTDHYVPPPPTLGILGGWRTIDLIPVNITNTFVPPLSNAPILFQNFGGVGQADNPEPATIGLLALGLAAVALRVRRR